MSLFTSTRERRLWLWATAVLVAIYSTLGPAVSLANALRAHNFLRISFAAMVVVIAASLAWAWIKRPPNWSEVGVALGTALAYWMVWVRMASWEERTHLIEYGIVAALIHMALLERHQNGRSVPRPAVVAFVATALLGLLDETIQALLPNRVFDPRDIFFNAFAGFMVIAARLAIAPQHRPGWRVWFLWLLAASIGWGNGVYWGWSDGTEPKTLQTVPDELLVGYLGLVSGALCMGILQAFILWRRIPRAGLWIVASIAAIGVAGGLVFGLAPFGSDIGWFVGVTAFGPVVGALQWGILRKHTPRAALWIAASSLGWLAGMPLGDMAGPPGLGAFYGAVTATTLVWLLRQHTVTSSPVPVTCPRWGDTPARDRPRV